MQRLSIARSLRLALLGLTVALAVVAALGLASIYSARQRYERSLQRAGAVAVAGADLATAAIAQDGVLARGTRRHGGARTEVSNAYAAAAASATSLAHGDPPSQRLIAAQIALQTRARALTATDRASRIGDLVNRQRGLAAQLEAREGARRVTAQRKAHSETRRAVVLVALAGALALIAALGLITALVGAMRRSLDELVRATRALAGGELERRVRPSGPRELQELGAAFNSMAGELFDAHRRIDQERQRLAVTIESLADGLVVTEPGSGTIATVNPRAGELAPELAVGGRVDGEASPLPALQKALRDEIVVEHHGRTLAINAAALGNDRDGAVWTIRDVSERARLERAKSEFVATVSHELRSPLTSIKGFVELLERSPESMSPRQREFVGIILRSTDRLVDLVNDLLDVARIEADQVEINRRAIDVGEAVREVTALMAPRFAAKDQRLGTYVAPTLPLALADPARVRQIVANLLTNAHLYTAEGGRIHVGVEPDRAWIQIVVEDSGIGMSEEESARVFERFFRARSQGQDGQPGGALTPGTGLGMAIVKSLVDLHDGEIEVDSQPGRGTRFRVLLPTAVPGPESGRSLEAIRGRKILIVDDEPEVAELIAGQLAPLEVQATLASSGEEALEQLQSTHYDALTLDILMPNMGGLEVLRRIRAEQRLSQIPIVFVSVVSDRHELAGEWVVSKPIDADELRGVLGAAVMAGRSRVLVVGREEMQPALEPALDDLGIEHQWEMSGAAAARVCGERRFEVALVDTGIRNPGAVLQALDLRGRRVRRRVILFSDGEAPPPAGLANEELEVVPVEQAAAAVLATLRSEREA